MANSPTENPKPTPPTEHCWSSLPIYRPGTGLSAEQLNASQSDAQTRTRILNLGMNGVGIAHGYQLTTRQDGTLDVRDGCIEISCGLAFDRYGRMLYWKGGWISMKDILGCKPDCTGQYCLRVHYAEESEKGKFDPCYDSTDWISTCVGFTLEKDCCSDVDCLPEVNACDCIERNEYICQRNGFSPPDEIGKDADLKFACQEPPQLELSNCGRKGFDPKEGLSLACVEICVSTDKACDDDYEFCCDSQVKACKMRKTAYRNQLLYELISRKDVPLSKVKTYSWSDYEAVIWHDDVRMPFSRFRKRAKACLLGKKPEKGFLIRFTRPLMRQTLNPMSVVMDIHIPQERPAYWMPHRVPAEIMHLDENDDIIHSPRQPYAWGILICPEKAWIMHELEDPASSILDCANKGYLARVEVLLFGHVIRDACGRMLDARPRWVDKVDDWGRWFGHPDDPCDDRAGQDRPGGTWRSHFRIARDYDDDRETATTAAKAHQADLERQAADATAAQHDQPASERIDS